MRLCFYSIFTVVFGSNLIDVIEILGSNLTEFELSRIELKLVSPDLCKNLRFLKVLFDILLPVRFSTDPVSKKSSSFIYEGFTEVKNDESFCFFSELLYSNSSSLGFSFVIDLISLI